MTRKLGGERQDLLAMQAEDVILPEGKQTQEGFPDPRSYHSVFLSIN